MKRGLIWTRPDTFIDYDHDGDLDLVRYCRGRTRMVVGEVIKGRYRPVLQSNVAQQWRWHLHGCERDLGLSDGVLQEVAVGTDYNNDRAVDIVVTGWRTVADNL